MDKCWVTETCKKYKNGTCNENEFCIKKFKLEYLYKNSLLSENQWYSKKLFLQTDLTDKEEFDLLKNIEISILEFVDSGKNLYIHSKICGNGKTAWAVKLIQAYLNRIWAESSLTCKALFINVPRFLLTLKDSITTESEYINHIKKYVLDADLVVWDEVGVKALTNYEHEHLLNLINTRLDEGKSNIYTSNLDAEELREKVGERLYSRISNLSIDIEFHGVDKRGMI